MKLNFLSAASMLGLIAVLAMPVLSAAQARPARYTVADLGTLGGTYSFAYGINNSGMVAGGAATPSQTDSVSQTATLWLDTQPINLGTLGGAACPDCSSEGAAARANGEVAVLSETANADVNGEDFCGFGTYRQCLAAIWKNGELTALATLSGGNNSQALWVNNQGYIIGLSENGILDSTCITATPFQATQFEAVIWAPGGEVRELSPLQGDTVSFGFGINDHGQAVGSSGLCSNTARPPFTTGPLAAHAVLWERDGSPHDLGSLVSGATINIPGGINNRGEVAGGAQSSDGTPHAFLWTEKTGMRDLGTLPGDFLSAAPCCHTINDRGQVVGFSIPGPLGFGRAFLWENGVMTDLNALVPANSPWYLLQAASINDAGEIAGIALNLNTFEVHAVLASPIVGIGPSARSATKPGVLPQSVVKNLQRQLHISNVRNVGNSIGRQ
jgi:probable HAF family extracellular repeat protein